MIYLPMLLAVTAGLRISEITGLRYSDIDFLGKKLFVERQLGKDLYMEKQQENRPVLCSELPLKTKNSKRAVVLADFVLDEILLERSTATKNWQSFWIQGSWIWATSAVMKTGSAITVVFISSLTTA